MILSIPFFLIRFVELFIGKNISVLTSMKQQGDREHSREPGTGRQAYYRGRGASRGVPHTHTHTTVAPVTTMLNSGTTN